MLKKCFALIVFILAVSCERKDRLPGSGEKKPIVWVSIAPYQGLAQRLAGSQIQVETIVPQNLNPHSFEPTAKQVAHMHEGLVWFYIGEPFEKKLLELLNKRSPNLKTLDLRNKIDLITEEEALSCVHCRMDHQDRHIWMSPKDTQTQVVEMAKLLQETFPDQKEEIAKNLDLLLEDLRVLDAKIHELIDRSNRRTILVSHPAFGYFCRDYACEQLSIEYEGKDPRPKHIENVLAKASQNKTGIGIALPQYNNKGAQLIAEKLHIPVKMVDPYSPNYFQTLLRVAQLIADGEEAKPS